ncbi:MAG: Wzz/FepE/Etk N-terminal domain-containing protein, partial [Terracidiphilus sp.]
MKVTSQSVAEASPDIEIHRQVEARGQAERPKGVAWLWLFWENRRFLWRVSIRGLIAAVVVAVILPPRYTSTTRLMPPDQSGGSGMLAAMAGSALSAGSSGTGGGLGSLGGSLGSIAGDMLGLKTSGALFVEMLHSRTVQDAMISRFDLRKVYWDKYWETARADLTKRTTVTEDKKSGVIEISVSDRNRERSQRMAQAYVDELDRLVAQVSTSSARRERIFLEQRLVGIKQDLEKYSTDLSQYESANTVLDLPSQAKAMVESAALLQGQLIAAQSELQGLEQIYTPENVRVRSLQARVAELKN